MGFFDKILGNSGSNNEAFEWALVTTPEDWANIVSKSEAAPVVVFKHSPRCAVSRMALSTFEKEWDDAGNTDVYMLPVLEAREVSNQIAREVEVRHESPQLLLLHKGKAAGHWSHQHIDAATVQRQLALLREVSA